MESTWPLLASAPITTPCPKLRNLFYLDLLIFQKSEDEVLFLPFIVDDDEYVNVYTDGACLQNGRSKPKAGVGVWFGDDHPM